MSTGFAYELLRNDGAARRGRIDSAHGKVETPAFMPVGTAGTVKAMTPEALGETGAEIILGNTYHLMLRPGAERIARLGGLHRFMAWPGPILTDSGGYQVMSLAKLARVSEAGVAFQSHLDGAALMLTPERATEVQALLDATITMALDECTAWPCEESTAAQSMRLSLRWAERSRAAFPARRGYGQFGIVQGSVYAGLREESAKALTAIGFEGYAVGGLAVGEGPALMLEMLEATLPYLPAERPRYLMGVGKPEDIIAAVARGVDLFDCVIPTRSGRTGQAFTRRGVVNIRNARHAEDPRPLDEACRCPACRSLSRAYLHHLVKAGEILGAMLLTWHNLVFYQELMAALRRAIEEERFAAVAAQLGRGLAGGDLAPFG